MRRVLGAMFAELGSTQLTHKLLVTLMVEVTAIVNARPGAYLLYQRMGMNHPITLYAFDIEGTPTCSATWYLFLSS